MMADRRIWTWLLVALLVACSDDSGDGASGDGAPPSGGAAAAPAAGGAGASGMAGVPTAAAGAAAAPPAGGSGGAGAGGAGGTPDADASAGDGAGDGGAVAGQDAAVDSGTDAGPPPTVAVCSAPVPATSPGNACPAGDPVALVLTEIASGLDEPLALTYAPGDDSGRMFVAQRGGSILVLDASGSSLGEFLNISVTTGFTEQGLLGLAFDPRYQDNGRFYVNYTINTGFGTETRIEGYRVSAGDPNVADPSSQELLFSFDQPNLNHNGGALAFGPDGCLFVGTGDGGGSNDPDDAGQTLSSPRGKILRFDPDAPDVAPPGNMAAAVPFIWSYGLRNPWRFSFDRATGDMYIGDVGQGAWEEVDVEPAGTAGLNYGWKIMEGNHCRGSSGAPTGCDASGKTPPVDEYANAGANNCVIGGHVYRGSAIPSLQGWYLYGDNGSNNIWAFVWDGAGRCGDSTLDLTQRDGLSLGGEITSFGEDADGELYVMTRASGGHRIYRVEAAP